MAEDRQTPPDGEHGSEEERVRSTVDAWKRKLLDLSGRNRALNFKVTKVSTVTIVEEQPAEVFRLLYLQEKALRFKASSERDMHPAPVENVPTAITEFDEDSGAAEADFVPYDPSDLEDRHRDGFLQTSASTDALDKSLRRIDEQARVSLEELGINTLFLTLGMLHYKESRDSDIVLKAPLVLVPVQLERKSARSGYALLPGDDEPIVNPALREYLKRSYGIALPDIPGSDVITGEYDLQTFLGDVLASVAGQEHWSVKTDIFLGLFSFQKFVMYKDLEANAPAVVSHRLIRKLVTRAGNSVIGMPSEIREMKLDESFPPESTAQVVDADSSQLRALAAAAKGHDVVIEGPPGTGKSQTITNLIAQALAADKSVLFVAEKMAALQVVYHRLVQAGLGDFCLELHSTKAQKRKVIQGIATALDSSLQPVVAPTASTQRLPPVRHSLNEYVTAVHSPYGACETTPYRAYGELGAVLNAPRVQWRGQPLDVSREQLDETIRGLQHLALHAQRVGDLKDHPWRDATKTFYSPSILEEIDTLADAFGVDLANLERQIPSAQRALPFSPIKTFGDVNAIASVADAIEQSPGAPVEVLVSDRWDTPPAEALDIVRRLKDLLELQRALLTELTAAAFEHEHAGDIEYVEKRSGGPFGFLALLDRRYRAIRRRWTSYRTPGNRSSLLEQAESLRRVDRYLAERRALDSLGQQASLLFGALWRGGVSDVAALEQYMAWVVGFRSLFVRYGLADGVANLAACRGFDATPIRTLEELAAKARTSAEPLRDTVGWPQSYLTDRSFADLAVRTSQLRDRLTAGPQWAAFEEARQSVSAGIAAELLRPLFEGAFQPNDLPSAFKRAFWMKWLSQAVEARPPLAKFNSLTHEERIAEFRNLDSRVLLENRAGLIGQLRDRVQHKLQYPEAAAALPLLQREMAKQRNLSPLRRTLRDAEPAIRAIKPCFLMSPLTVAQYTRGGPPAFDLVIFDEASQLPPEDAVGAIVRGNQLAVVGDPKQLPPTTFFSTTIDATQLYAPDGTPIYQDAESVLEEFMGAGLPMSRLKWHYRSSHESLITFSNVSFYDADLYTFPSVEIGIERQGLSFEYVQGASYEGKGLNAVEARRVADEVVSFARQQLKLRQSGMKMVSLGVGTFNLRQQLAIQDELEIRRRAEPRIEPFFDRGVDEPFFVKNLENIQGDERDVIFISVTYARAADGQLRYQFGPLNGQNGWRRLNVLTTRARRQMRVFSSMRGDEISPAATTSDGPRLLREFLLYAEHGRLESARASRLSDTESPFEREVLAELIRRGIKALPQVGVAGYRIDIGVLDDEVQGRFVCGIECDGAAYHSSETARDRDRLRHEVLENRGWALIRVWSTDWFKDRAGQIERLLKAIDAARTRVRTEHVAEQEATQDESGWDNTDAQSESIGLHESVNPIAVVPNVSVTPDSEYRRPTAQPYVVTPGYGQFAGYDILQADDNALTKALQAVIDLEAPIHVAELMTRVAGMWGSKAGSRIQARINVVASRMVSQGTTRRRNDFFWGPSDDCPIRSRAETKISADRIAPEEFERAILLVLSGGHHFQRPLLTSEVRSLLGYSRTGAIIEEAVSDAISRLLASGRLGEGSAGLTDRTSKSVTVPAVLPEAAKSHRTVNLGDGVGFEMAIVGESYYGLEIKKIAGTRLAQGEEVIFNVTLRREPDNQYDPNAVAVVGTYGKKIGHLSREYAIEYKPVLELLESRGLVANCSAKMFGGKGHKQNVGVWLDIEPVDVLLARFALDGDEQPF
jgi:very-short-patch-repair endonuclease